MILRNPENGNCICIDKDFLTSKHEYYGSFITKEPIENVLLVFPKSSNFLMLCAASIASKSEFAEDKVELLDNSCEICATFRNIYLTGQEELDNGNTKYEIRYDWEY